MRPTSGQEAQKSAISAEMVCLDPVGIFGAREIGVMAWRCRAGPHYHIK